MVEIKEMVGRVCVQVTEFLNLVTHKRKKTKYFLGVSCEKGIAHSF